jgi:hypothetical protein
MFGDGALSFREFVAGEPLPLATVHDAVLEFLRGREDGALIGSQAVNAYVDEPRMTQDVDIASSRAPELAEELCAYLNARFSIAVQAQQAREGRGFRLVQTREPKNRHLVDIRPATELPLTQRVRGVLVVIPAELVAGKVRVFQQRRGTPKSFTDWRDIAKLLLTFPKLKTDPGPVRDRLVASGVDPEVLSAWKELVAQEILPEDEDDEFSP